MKSHVTMTQPAKSEKALAHFSDRLEYETDCWDVHQSIIDAKQNGHDKDFVLLDVRGPNAYEKSHIPTAINLPHAKIIKSKMDKWPQDTVFVVYCAGPHCNGANKAAIRLAKLGRPVKEMIGGMTGWADEGFEFA